MPTSQLGISLKMPEPTDFNLPKQANLERMANRVRQKLRPAEPTDLSFEV